MHILRVSYDGVSYLNDTASVTWSAISGGAKADTIPTNYPNRSSNLALATAESDTFRVRNTHMESAGSPKASRSPLLTSVCFYPVLAWNYIVDFPLQQVSVQLSLLEQSQQESQLDAPMQKDPLWLTLSEFPCKTPPNFSTLVETFFYNLRPFILSHTSSSILLVLP
jgi:hypothetical protein